MRSIPNLYIEFITGIVLIKARPQRVIDQPEIGLCFIELALAKDVGAGNVDHSPVHRSQNGSAIHFRRRFFLRRLNKRKAHHVGAVPVSSRPCEINIKSQIGAEIG